MHPFPSPIVTMMNVVTMIVPWALRVTRRDLDHDCVLGFESHENGTLILTMFLIWIRCGVWHGSFGFCGNELLACSCILCNHINHESGFESDDNCVCCDTHHDHERACLENDWSISPWADDSLDV